MHLNRVWGTQVCTPSPAVLSSGPVFYLHSPAHSLLGLDYFGANVGHHLAAVKIFQTVSLKDAKIYTWLKNNCRAMRLSEEINNHFLASWNIWPASKISRLWTLEAPPPTPNVPPTPTPESAVCWLKKGILKGFLRCNWLILLLASLGVCLHFRCILF